MTVAFWRWLTGSYATHGIQLPDGKPMSSNKDESDLTARGLYGNFVILQIAPGVFAYYAHLRPGSVRVYAGERVHSGEMIAHLDQQRELGCSAPASSLE